MDVDRRTFLLGLGAAATLAGCGPTTQPPSPTEHGSPTPAGGTPSSRSTASSSASATPAPGPSPSGSFFPSPLVSPSATPPALPTTKGPVPTGKSITALPIPGSYLAWTVDDGTDPQVVAAYAQMAQVTGNRVTFFLNGIRPSWTVDADRLRPMVASGQIQLGNHTWSHPDLRGLSTAGIQQELQRNEDFIQHTYGVSAKPFFRPPFGYINDHVRSAAAAIGYTAPTLWYGTLGDSALLTPDVILGLAQQWFLAGHVVIAHANHPPVLQVMQQLVDLVATRGLRTVTLRDVFAV